MTRLVILESPFAGDMELNLRYARAAMADCLRRGEAPFASHLLYTQPGVLDDTKPEERTLGINAGLAWGAKADATVVYVDMGVSPGMKLGIVAAIKAERTVEMRRLPVGRFCCVSGNGTHHFRSSHHNFAWCCHCGIGIVDLAAAVRAELGSNAAGQV